MLWSRGKNAEMDGTFSLLEAFVRRMDRDLQRMFDPKPPSPQIGTRTPTARFASMWYNYSLTNLLDYESEATAVQLDEHEVRSFGVRMTDEMLAAMPDLTSKGMCIVVYDTEEHPVSIVPLDPIQ